MGLSDGGSCYPGIVDIVVVIVPTSPRRHRLCALPLRLVRSCGRQVLSGAPWLLVLVLVLLLRLLLLVCLLYTSPSPRDRG